MWENTVKDAVTDTDAVTEADAYIRLSVFQYVHWLVTFFPGTRTIDIFESVAKEAG